MPLSDADEALFNTTFAALKGKVGGDILARDRTGTFDFDGWQACAQAGLCGLNVPEVLGGKGLNILQSVLVMEAFGLACEDNGLALELGAHLWGCLPILLLHKPQARADLIAAMAQGRTIGALAVSETGAGSDVGGIATRALRVDGGYRLTGHKIYITNAPIADVFIVLARTAEGGPAFALSAFVVTRGTPGLSTSASVEKMGLRTAQMGDVMLDDCFVADSARIGGEGAGLTLFLKAMELERGFILAPAIGSMQRLYDKSAAYARTREQFGGPIGDLAPVSGLLVDMAQTIETAQLLLRETAMRMDAGQTITQHSAMAKLTVSESWVAVATAAMAIFAGRGYLTETGIERELRDAFGGLFYSGTAQIQRESIARHLGTTRR